MVNARSRREEKQGFDRKTKKLYERDK